jgi:predicted lipoprotein with Yx(FWY)xxD motif
VPEQGERNVRVSKHAEIPERLDPHRSSAGVAGALCVATLTAASFLAAAAPPPAGAESTTTPNGSAAPVYEVKTGEVHGLGKVLVDGQGFTLYVFAPDKHSGFSKCYGRCASAWPPLVLPSGVTKAPAGSGVRSDLLGTTKRRDGTVEVTYHKWPLYTWVVDTAPGAATGQDLNNLGGKWYVITPAGALITKHP